MIQPPIVRAYENQLIDNAKKEARKELREKFIFREWHALALVCILSILVSFFQIWSLGLGAIALVGIILCMVLPIRDGSSRQISDTKEEESITTIGEE
jgi:hypothetical protein